MLLDIFLVLSVIIISRIGWSVGFTRIFFTVLAGFLAFFLASKYPHRYGSSLYLVFVITALATSIVGCFVARLINFLYMSFFDKIGGLVLNVLIWFILCINVIVPAVASYGNYALDKSSGKIYKTVSCFIKSRIPLFKDYVSPYAHLKSELQNFKNKI